MDLIVLSINSVAIQVDLIVLGQLPNLHHTYFITCEEEVIAIGCAQNLACVTSQSDEGFEVAVCCVPVLFNVLQIPQFDHAVLARRNKSPLVVSHEAGTNHVEMTAQEVLFT